VERVTGNVFINNRSIPRGGHNMYSGGRGRDRGGFIIPNYQGLGLGLGRQHHPPMICNDGHSSTSTDSAYFGGRNFLEDEDGGWFRDGYRRNNGQGRKFYGNRYHR